MKASRVFLVSGVTTPTALVLALITSFANADFGATEALLGASFFASSNGGFGSGLVGLGDRCVGSASLVVPLEFSHTSRVHVEICLFTIGVVNTDCWQLSDSLSPAGVHVISSFASHKLIGEFSSSTPTGFFLSDPCFYLRGPVGGPTTALHAKEHDSSRGILFTS